VPRPPAARRAYAIDCGDKAFSAPLRRRIARDRSSLFVFVTDRDVPATNNVSERTLRPSVVFRKVTNGFRAEWGAETCPEVHVSVLRAGLLCGSLPIVECIP
jgi:hypothetical protein